MHCAGLSSVVNRAAAPTTWRSSCWPQWSTSTASTMRCSAPMLRVGGSSTGTLLKRLKRSNRTARIGAVPTVSRSSTCSTARNTTAGCALGRSPRRRKQGRRIQRKRRRTGSYVICDCQSGLRHALLNSHWLIHCTRRLHQCWQDALRRSQ